MFLYLKEKYLNLKEKKKKKRWLKRAASLLGEIVNFG